MQMSLHQSPQMLRWQWPTSGNIIQGFASTNGGNKGIDISGSRGQRAVKAAAAGQIVYAGKCFTWLQ